MLEETAGELGFVDAEYDALADQALARAISLAGFVEIKSNSKNPAL